MALHSEVAQTAQSMSYVPAMITHEETIFGFGPPGIVALSMVAVLLIIGLKGGFRAFGAGLDKKIATIRTQLEEAASLRAEAEAMKAEYQKKAAEAHKDALAIVEHAKVEAAQLIEQARVDADLLIERRGKMAADKIAAAERGAIADVRARAATAATTAAASIIAERHDATADKALIDRAISKLN